MLVGIAVAGFGPEGQGDAAGGGERDGQAAGGAFAGKLRPGQAAADEGDLLAGQGFLSGDGQGGGLLAAIAVALLAAFVELQPGLGSGLVEQDGFLAQGLSIRARKCTR